MHREELFSGFAAETQSEEETTALGRALAGCLKKGIGSSCMGEPGAGKTALTRGICQGLGYDDYVTSPTFAIVNQYPARIPVYHFDLYRISPEELYDIGVEEYLGGTGSALWNGRMARRISWGAQHKDRDRKGGECLRRVSILGGKGKDVENTGFGRIGQELCRRPL